MPQQPTPYQPMPYQPVPQQGVPHQPMPRLQVVVTLFAAASLAAVAIAFRCRRTATAPGTW